MIIIKEVKSYCDGIRFTEFPNKLYKKVPYFVPALSLDERNVFNKKKNPVHEYVESIRFLAYKDKKLVGRIAGIYNYRINEAKGVNQVRFTRIDMIDDIEVTTALLKAVEVWGKAKGATEIIGPIGFTDLDRQGMLVEGFEELNSFITIYNHPYYHHHLELLGYVKDVDWLEKRIFWPKVLDEKIGKTANIIKQRYGYELITPKTKKEILSYIYEAFAMYNIAFNELYGFYPITDKVMDYYIKQVIAIVQVEYVWFVLDKEKKVVGFGAVMPSLSIANKKNNGKLFPFGWIRILKALKKHSVLDFYFIAIDPQHQNKGIISLIFEDGLKKGIKHGVTHAETGPELELNHAIHAQWKIFDFIEHKRRRCYKKSL